MALDPDKAFSENQIVTTDDLLAALRGGNDQKLVLNIGAFAIPVRLISASEEASIVVKATQAAIKNNPSGLKQEVFESYEAMKALLYAATSINGMPQIAYDFFQTVTKEQLADLYDSYVSMCRMINPNFKTLPVERVAEIVQDIKKKKIATRDLFTWELVGIGKYFLEEVIPNLPTANEPGSL